MMVVRGGEVSIKINHRRETRGAHGPAADAKTDVGLGSFTTNGGWQPCRKSVMENVVLPHMGIQPLSMPAQSS